MGQRGVEVFNRPFGLHFEVTDSCNNRCPHCYGSSWIQPGKRAKRAQRAKPHIIEVARHIVANDLFDVVITGGEPLLLGINRLSEICRLFSDNHIEYSLNSNGRLLTRETCKKLSNCGLKNLLISLHSWVDATHDEIVNASQAASETKAGIRNALDEGLHVVVNQVIDSRNIDTMYMSAAELEKMGVHQISFTRTLSPLGADYNVEMIDAPRFLDEFIKCQEHLKIAAVSLLPIPFCADPRVKDLSRKLCCSGGVSTAVLSCYGDVRFCPHDTQVWGNVLQEDLGSIWERIVKWRNDIAVPTECTHCSFVLDCRGGCRVASQLCCHDYAGKDPWARQPVTNYRRKVVFDEFDPEDLFVLQPDIRWRKEDEAFLLYSRGGRLLVNADGVEFIKCLPQEFVPRELLSATPENKEKHYDFLRVLYHHGLLDKAVTKKTLNVDMVSAVPLNC